MNTDMVYSLAPENSQNPSRSEQQVTYQRIHCTHTLDYSLYSHLSLTCSLDIPIRRPKTIGRRHRLVDPQQEQMLPGTANLIGRSVQIQKGPLKGYQGILQLVTLTSTIVELEAVTGNKLKSFKHSDVLIRDPISAPPKRARTPSPTLEQQLDAELTHGEQQQQHNLSGRPSFH